MTFNPNLKQNQEITSEELTRIFKCSTQGGMRKSNRTNTLVLLSYHTGDVIYNDRWENNILHYTGMGQNDHQTLKGNQNKTLYESDSNGVDVFLFEVFEKGNYTYQGRVKLADKPYQEQQLDSENKLRNVWMFPLKLVDEIEPSSIPEELYVKIEEKIAKKVSKLSDQELLEKIKTFSPRKGTRDVISKQHERNPYVTENALRRANGVCQLCGSDSPFNKKNGDPYLEVHHVQWLAKDGEDTIENTVALCPNCHKKMHILDLKKDKDHLLKQASLS